MRNCSVPGHPNAPMDPWSTVDNPVLAGVSVQDACATGAGVGFNIVAGTQLPGGTEFAFRLAKPDGPRRHIKFEKLVLWYATRLEGSGQPINLWAGHRLANGPYVLTLYNGPPGSEYLVAEQRLSPDSQGYQVGISCGPIEGVISPAPCVAANAVPLLIRGMEVTLTEDHAPSVLQPSGTLLDGGPQNGTRGLAYAASDAESGLSKIEVLLGDTLVASRDLTPRCTYSDFSVCPTAQHETLQVDTRAVPNGSHRLTVRARDAAGNVGLAQDGGTIEVANGPAPGGPYELAARFNGTKRATLTVPYGRRVRVSGRLGQASRPIAAGSLELLETPDRRGARERLQGRIRTRSDGTFSAVLVTTRPSRTVKLAYRPAGALPVFSRPLRLRVRAASRVRASLRGHLLRFRGRVISGPMPKRGKVIVMEGRAPGSAWTAFKTLRTSRSGRFAGTYRLRVRRPGILLKIRGVVPHEPGYGYVSSRSKSVAVRVR